MPYASSPAPVLDVESRSRLRWEVGIVLALSLGASAVYSLVRIVERVTRDTALSEQTATINTSLSARPGFDLAFQLLGIFFGLAPVALVLWLTWQERRPHFAAVGLTLATRNDGALDGGGGKIQAKRWITHVGSGCALAAMVGVPGLVFYVSMRFLGWNTTVVPTEFDAYWWTVPVLVLQALKAALLEEIIVVGYLFDRLTRLGMGVWSVVLFSAALRGTYHLYQGFGGCIGNVVMGLLFAWIYHRTRRLVPLIVAHWLLDIVSFVGYPLALAWFPGWFG